MIDCYYKEVANKWDDMELQFQLSQLPPNMVQEALLYNDPRQRRLFIEGRLLLAKMLTGRGTMNGISLNDMKYTEAKRPYFEGLFDFNISHSENIVVCATIEKGKIGVDIEAVKAVELPDYRPYFTMQEWSEITDENSFYRM